MNRMDMPITYAVKHKDEDVRLQSRSGGIFTAVSDYVLRNNGVVYGCVLNEKFEAVHARAESVEIRDKMRGSKYVQSNLGNTFTDVKKDLDLGKCVLFTGTSCQVDGLRHFLGKDYEGLFCIDIVCHGVPSPLIWKQYLEWQEEQNKSAVLGVNFRNKIDFGWRSHIESLTLENGNTIHSNVFTTLFYDHSILRPSCYKCPYKKIMHPGDITIADYWGIENAAPLFDDDRGVSLVLVNNEKGIRVFGEIEDSICFQETRIEDSMQPPLCKPFEAPKGRNRFWMVFRKNGIDGIINRYVKDEKVGGIKGLVIKLKNRVMSRLS